MNQLLINATKALALWLNELSYEVSRQIVGNYFIAESYSCRKIALVLINRQTYQTYINCVDRWKFQADLVRATSLQCDTLYYVMYLQENNVQLIISQYIVESYFAKSRNKLYSISMENTLFGEDYDYDHCVVLRQIKSS
jgi:hypothetical protein